MTDATTATGRWRPIFAGAVGRHRALTVLTALIFGALAAGLVYVRGQTYTAQATVFIRPLTNNAFNSSAQSNNQASTVALQTEANLVGQDAVTQRVNRAIGTHFGSGTSVVKGSVPTNTQLVLITGTADTAGKARKYVQAYAEQFLAYRTSLAAGSQKKQLDRLNAEVASARQALASASAAANVKNPTPEESALLQQATNTLSNYEAQIASAQAIVTDPGTVARPAHVIPRSVLKSPPVLIGAGVVIGLVIGLILAFWRELRNNRLRVRGQRIVEGASVAATAPATADASWTATVRGLRVAVLASAPHRAVVTFAPLSGRESSAAARASIELGRSLHAAGYRVALVDAEVDRPRLAAALGVPPAPGVSDALGTAAGRFTSRQVDGLAVVPAGSKPVKVRDRYGGDAFLEAVTQLHDEHDYVLVVTSPLESTDGVAVLRPSAHAFVVVSDGQTERAELAAAVELLDRLTVDMLGLLVLPEATRGGVDYTPRKPITTSSGKHSGQPRKKGADKPVDKSVTKAADKSLSEAADKPVKTGSEAGKPDSGESEPDPEVDKPGSAAGTPAAAKTRAR